MTVVDVYVPAPHAKTLASLLDPRSAITGATRSDGRVDIYYEGGRYRQSGFDQYETRLLHAAGRLVQRYPTIARSVEDASDLVRVGTYDTDTNEFFVLDQDALAEWTDA